MCPRSGLFCITEERALIAQHRSPLKLVRTFCLFQWALAHPPALQVITQNLLVRFSTCRVSLWSDSSSHCISSQGDTHVVMLLFVDQH